MFDATPNNPENPADTAAPDDIKAAAPRATWRRKFLSTVFSRRAATDIVVGMGFSTIGSMAAKAGTVVALGTVGAPVMGTAIIAAVAGGIVSGAMRHTYEWSKEKRENPGAAPAFFSKKALKTILLSSVFSGTGGALFAGLDHFYGDEIRNVASKAIEHVTPAFKTVLEAATGSMSERVDAVAKVVEHVESSLEVIQGPYTGTLSAKAAAIASDISWAAQIFVGAEPHLLDTPPYAETYFTAPDAAVSPGPAAPIAPVAALGVADLSAAPSPLAVPAPLDLSTIVPPPPVMHALPSLTQTLNAQLGAKSVFLPDLSGYFDAPAAAAPAPAPAAIPAPVPAAAFAIDPALAAPAGVNVPVTTGSTDLISLTLDPGQTMLALPSDDDLRSSLQGVLEGRTIRPSTQALMDLAFGTADTAEAAAQKAQAMKDLAYFTLNGFGGVPQNDEVGLALMQSAAAAGNTQAKVDLAYTAYHGVFGAAANPAAALEHMQTLATEDARAQRFVYAWTQSGPQL